MQNIVTTAMADRSINTSAELVQKTLDVQKNLGNSPINTAKRAIKKEIDIIL